MPPELEELIEMFHAKLDEATSNEILETFTATDGFIRCLVATIAIGMGMEVPNISYVMHWGAPSSLYDYWQEVGRCARDGSQGHAILYSPPQSLRRQRCDTEIIDFVHKSCSQCLRKQALNALQVTGIADIDIERCCGGKNCCISCDKSLALHK